ncbi:hypothetical protein Tco_0539900 [Tanacetum coccineum]
MAALQYKDDHNRIAYLGRERGSEDFTDILSYLDHSPLRYALTHAPPVVFDSLVKQFWATAVVRPNAAGSHDLVATIDGREVVVTESLIRTQLHFDDANGIFDMPNSDILAGMRVIGYPTDRALTFLKHHLSPQWRFLVHTLMHCLSPKSGSWNQFPSSIATALICLSTDRVYNFSRFIIEGMIGNVKATKNKFLMYPRFLQMIVAIETADRTPRPTFGFTRKLFANMRFKWEGQPIPLTPPMLAIAAAGDAADEENADAYEAAGSTAEAHPAPHSPPFSPVRESTPERQPETEWVVPNPVSPGTDWRPWPSVPAHSPIRDHTNEPASPPTPPAQTVIFEVPLVFGPVPRPAGYVDPDTIDPIIFGPQPRPYDFVDPALEEPVIFGPPPRPDNYIEPEDIDNLVSMEDDTILGGFHEDSPAGPDDAPTPTADAAGRAEDPVLLTSLSAKIDRCMGRIDSLETELGTSKKIMGGAILTLVSRVKKLERTVKQLKTARFVGDAPATEGDVNIQDDVDLEGLSRMASEALGHDQPAVPSEDIEEREEEEVPLRRKRSVYRRARTEFNTSAFAQFHAPLSADVLPQAAISESAGPSAAADKGKAPMPELDIPAEFLAEDAQARQRLEEEQASERLVQRLRAEDLAKEDLPNVSEERAKELDDLMMRMTETDWLNLMMQVGSNPALARELLGADVTEANFVERMTAIKERKKRALADLRYRALKGKPLKQSEVTQMMRNLVKNQWCAAHHGTITMKAVKAMSKQQLIDEYEYICRHSACISFLPAGSQLSFVWLCSPLLSAGGDFSALAWIDDDMETYIPPSSYGDCKDWDDCASILSGHTLARTMLRQQAHRSNPHIVRDVVVCWELLSDVFQKLAYGNPMMFCNLLLFSPWLTANKETGSPLQTALVCNSNPLMVATLPKPGCYLVSAGTCFCCYSILLLREDLSRNLELTESKPSLGEDCGIKLKRQYLSLLRYYLSADTLSHSCLTVSSSIPADYVSCWSYSPSAG